MKFTKSVLSVELEGLESDMAMKVDNLDDMPHTKLLSKASVPFKSWLIVCRSENPEEQDEEVHQEVEELFYKFSIQDIEIFTKLFSISWDLRSSFMHLQAEDTMYCMRLEDEDRRWMIAEVERETASTANETIN